MAFRVLGAGPPHRFRTPPGTASGMASGSASPPASITTGVCGELEADPALGSAFLLHPAKNAKTINKEIFFMRWTFPGMPRIGVNLEFLRGWRPFPSELHNTPRECGN